MCVRPFVGGKWGQRSKSGQIIVFARSFRFSSAFIGAQHVHMRMKGDQVVEDLHEQDQSGPALGTGLGVKCVTFAWTGSHSLVLVVEVTVG